MPRDLCLRCNIKFRIRLFRHQTLPGVNRALRPPTRWESRANGNVDRRVSHTRRSTQLLTSTAYKTVNCPGSKSLSRVA